MLTAASNKLGRSWHNAVSFVHKVESMIYGVWVTAKLAKDRRMARSQPKTFFMLRYLDRYSRSLILSLPSREAGCVSQFGQLCSASIKELS
jgi:hypothetical protein